MKLRHNTLVWNDLSDVVNLWIFKLTNLSKGLRPKLCAVLLIFLVYSGCDVWRKLESSQVQHLRRHPARGRHPQRRRSDYPHRQESALRLHAHGWTKADGASLPCWNSGLFKILVTLVLCRAACAMRTCATVGSTSMMWPSTLMPFTVGAVRSFQRPGVFCTLACWLPIPELWNQCTWLRFRFKVWPLTQTRVRKGH